jgi:hypothetical protein
MKFIGKNVEEMASPVLSSLLVNLSSAEPRVKSPFSPEEINREFSKYLESVGPHMQKHKANCLKRAQILESSNLKELEREEQENELKISKIPEQYFSCSESFREQGPAAAHEQHSPTHPQHTLLSTKLQSLLQLEQCESSGRKNRKEKRGPLSRKQEDLEEHLDQIELIIYNKTRKYPDKYLHYLTNLNNSDLELGSLLDKIAAARVQIEARREVVRDRYRRVVELQGKRGRVEGLLALMQTMRTVHEFRNEPERLAGRADPSDLSKTKLKSTEMISQIRRDPNLPRLHKLSSIAQTLGNIEELSHEIKTKKIQQISKMLLRNLT